VRDDANEKVHDLEVHIEGLLRIIVSDLHVCIRTCARVQTHTHTPTPRNRLDIVNGWLERNVCMRERTTA
jgi:hypothetical protein